MAALRAEGLFDREALAEGVRGLQQETPHHVAQAPRRNENQQQHAAAQRRRAHRRRARLDPPAPKLGVDDGLDGGDHLAGRDEAAEIDVEIALEAAPEMPAVVEVKV